MVQHSSLSCIAIDNRLMNLTDFSFDQEKVLAFLQWLDTSFPADPSVSAPKLWCKFGSSLGNVLLMNWVLRQYASPGMMDRDGPIFLRPWHLPWASECGLKGVLEPASCHHNYRWLVDNVMLILKVGPFHLQVFRWILQSWLRTHCCLSASWFACMAWLQIPMCPGQKSWPSPNWGGNWGVAQNLSSRLSTLILVTTSSCSLTVCFLQKDGLGPLVPMQCGFAPTNSRHFSRQGYYP